MKKSDTLNAMENAAKNLPEGFRIEISIEKDSGSVCLFDTEGNELDFPCNRNNLVDEIMNAVEHAVEIVQAPGVDIQQYFPGGID